MKFGVKEVIAVAVALVLVGGFFLQNQSSPVGITDTGAEGGAAVPLQGFQQLLDRGNSELVVEDLTIGSGTAAAAGDQLTVHYAGILTDGTQFDSSVTRGQPFTFTLGRGQVIAGWDQGLLGMREGGRRVLIIPPELGYGSRGTANIPPDSTLIFEVLLLEVK